MQPLQRALDPEQCHFVYIFSANAVYFLTIFESILYLFLSCISSEIVCSKTIGGEDFFLVNGLLNALISVICQKTNAYRNGNSQAFNSLVSTELNTQSRACNYSRAHLFISLLYAAELFIDRTDAALAHDFPLRSSGGSGGRGGV